MIAKKSPLQGKKIGHADSLEMRERPNLRMIDLRVAPESAAQKAVAEALGLELPKKVGQTFFDEKSSAHALCLAPDWWLVVGSEDAEKKLAPLKMEHHFSVVDVSGQRTAIELEGPNAAAALAHFWEQDLRERSFPVGSVSQGLMAKAPVIVWHVAPQRFCVLVRSSFARHFWLAMEDAAVELV